MKTTVEQKIREMLPVWRRRGHWRRALSAMMALVVFVTTYALILPAITADSETFCGYSQHEHSVENGCFTQERSLACGREEGEGHAHADGCYVEESALACGREEADGHIHADSCYAGEALTLCAEEHEHSEECGGTEPALVCGLDEEPGHTHTDECYGTELVLACGQSEAEPHVHTDDCYEIDWALACETPEHKHTMECFSDREADVETAAVWERELAQLGLTGEWAHDVALIAQSQLGYRESEKNYAVDEAGEVRGYTRYGAWYGNPYGRWNAMFVSFCLNYAGVPRGEMPIEHDAARWALALGGRLQGADCEVRPGDLVFLDMDNDGAADRVAIVYTVEENALTVIEGGADGHVQKRGYSRGDAAILGYAPLPEQPAQAPEPTEEPASIDEPATTEEPTAAEEPAVTDVPTATEEPASIDEPATTEEPAVTDEPATAEEPASTDEPAATEEPAVTDEPAATEEPAGTDEPAATEEPALSFPAQARTLEANQLLRAEADAASAVAATIAKSDAPLTLLAQATDAYGAVWYQAEYIPAGPEIAPEQYEEYMRERELVREAAPEAVVGYLRAESVALELEEAEEEDADDVGVAFPVRGETLADGVPLRAEPAPGAEAVATVETAGTILALYGGKRIDGDVWFLAGYGEATGYVLAEEIALIEEDGSDERAPEAAEEPAEEPVEPAEEPVEPVEPEEPVEYPFEEPRDAVVLPGGASLRERPDEAAAELTSLEEGEALRLTGEVRVEGALWYAAACQDMTGYVFSGQVAVRVEEHVLTAVADNGMRISMTAPETSLPFPAEELRLEAALVENEAALKLVESQVRADDDMRDAAAGDEAAAAPARRTLLFDIRIMRGDEEVQPIGPVFVSFGGVESNNGDARAFHVDPAAEQVEEMPLSSDEDGDLVIETGHFSLYALTYTYTVDFHFGSLVFSIAGEGQIWLSELLERLGIERGAAEAVEVRFTNPALLAAVQAEREGAADWLLTSLAPFNTTETLTIVFADGEALEILVTDATNGEWGTCSWTLNDQGLLTISPTNGVSGTMGGGRPIWSSDEAVAAQVKSVVFEPGVTAAANSASMFHNCAELVSVDFTNLNTANTTIMASMFYGCAKLTSITFGPNWNTAKVVSFASMFAGCSSLPSLDLTLDVVNGVAETNGLNRAGFDTSAATNMSTMFGYCDSLTSLDVKGFNTSQVINMLRMFLNCSNLSTIDGVGSFNTSKAMYMYQMFCNCRVLTSLDLSSWDTSSATLIYSMFQGCNELVSLNVAPKEVTRQDGTTYTSWDVSNVTNMSAAFCYCNKLASLDVSKWNPESTISLSAMFRDMKAYTGVLDISGWSTPACTDMNNMFYGMEKLTGIKFGPGFVTDNVTTMIGTFMACGLTELNLSLADSAQNGLNQVKFNTALVTSMASMFRSSVNLTRLNLSGFNTGSVTSMSNMFMYCYRLTGSIGLEGWDVRSVTTMIYMFLHCYGLESLDLSAWKTDSLAGDGMRAMFQLTVDTEARSDYTGWPVKRLRELKFGPGWNTANCTSLDSVFYGQSRLTELDVSMFDTANVTTMYGAFYQMSSLEAVTFGAGWDTGNVTYMNVMFYRCESLPQLDLSSNAVPGLNAARFDTSSCTNMNSMFCYNNYEKIDAVSPAMTANTLRLYGWDTSKVESMSGLFSYSYKLTEIDISSFRGDELLNLNSVLAYSGELRRANISFATPKLTTAGRMFGQCGSETAHFEVDMTDIDVRNFVGTFSGWGNQDAIYMDKVKIGPNWSMPAGFIGYYWWPGYWLREEDGIVYSAAELSARTRGGSFPGTYVRQSQTSVENPFAVTYAVRPDRHEGVKSFTSTSSDFLVGTDGNIFVRIHDLENRMYGDLLKDSEGNILTDAEGRYVGLDPNSAPYKVPGQATVVVGHAVQDGHGNWYDLEIRISDVRLHRLNAEYVDPHMSAYTSVLTLASSSGSSIMTMSNVTYKDPDVTSGAARDARGTTLAVQSFFATYSMRVLNPDGTQADQGYLAAVWHDMDTNPLWPLETIEGVNLLRGLDQFTVADPSRLYDLGEDTQNPKRWKGYRFCGKIDDGSSDECKLLARADSTGFEYEMSIMAGLGTGAFASNQPETFKIQKVKPNGDMLAGADLTLYRVENNVETEIDSWRSTVAGAGRSFFLQRGSYVLRETDAPQYYMIADDLRFRVDYDQKVWLVDANGVETANPTDEVVKMVDPPVTGSLTIEKFDEGYQNKMPGAVFTVTGESTVHGVFSVTSTDNGDGTYVVTGIPVTHPTEGEDYTVIETTPPRGYTASSRVHGGWRIVVKDPNDPVERYQGTTEACPDVEDKLIKPLTIIKRGNKTGTTETVPLAGARFKIVNVDDANDGIIGTTGSDGKWTINKATPGFSGFIAGATYRLTEVAVPDPYKTAASSWLIKVHPDDDESHQDYPFKVTREQDPGESFTYEYVNGEGRLTITDEAVDVQATFQTEIKRTPPDDTLEAGSAITVTATATNASAWSGYASELGGARGGVGNTWAVVKVDDRLTVDESSITAKFTDYPNDGSTGDPVPVDAAFTYNQATHTIRARFGFTGTANGMQVTQFTNWQDSIVITFSATTASEPVEPPQEPYRNEVSVDHGLVWWTESATRNISIPGSGRTGVFSSTDTFYTFPATVTLKVTKNVVGDTASGDAFEFKLLVESDRNKQVTVDVTDAAGQAVGSTQPFNPDADGNITATFQLAHGQTAALGGIPKNAKVTLTETKHDGYKPWFKRGDQTLASGATYTIDSITIEDTATPVTVENRVGTELPHTGGPGTHLYTLGGLALMLAAFVYGLRLRRRERREN